MFFFTAKARQMKAMAKRKRPKQFKAPKTTAALEDSLIVGNQSRLQRRKVELKAQWRPLRRKVKLIGQSRSLRRRMKLKGQLRPLSRKVKQKGKPNVFAGLMSRL